MTPTLVLTRSQKASLAFAKQVRDAFEAPLQTIISPAMMISDVPGVVPPKTDNLIFTSANGVDWAQRHGVRAGEAWCVGVKTAQAAKEVADHVQSADGTAEDLITLILAHRPAGPLLHLTGEHQRGNVAQRLRDAGLICTAQVVYRQTLNPPSEQLVQAARGTNPLVAPVFSPRSALLFGQLDVSGQLHGVAMSDAVAQVMVDVGFDTVATARHPNAHEMAETTLKTLQRVTDGCI